MSSKKKKSSAPMPASSAGLLRFFEDETPGIKIKPTYVIMLAISLVIFSIMLLILVPP
ncbi:MAG: preprotein translocase subunit Sec61beta [Nitrososphaeria archaeon]|nr:preprotein translocase subunit Sec61beta [Nitrososphaeria archaeon]